MAKKKFDAFNAPHVDDDTPIASSREELALAYKNKLIWAAEEFRKRARADWDPHITEIHRELTSIGNWIGRKHFLGSKLSETSLHTICGEVVIKAHEAQFFTDKAELCDLIEYHKSPTPPNGNRQAVQVHCPANLFTDVQGGNTVHVIYKPTGELEYAESDVNGNHVPRGGLMVRYFPDFLSLPTLEQSAQTCEWLANAIDMPPKDLISLSEAAGIAGFGKQLATLSKAIDRGELPGYGGKGKGKAKVDRRELTYWIQKRLKRTDAVESNATVEKLVRRAVKDHNLNPPKNGK